ncbi:MAG TPA: hypothetical protein VHL57_11295 [Flavobacteriales bacterium]|jgi:hypothetical protein|nr:hypothetical protein [Flavobacteriales bacterium]
MDTQRPRAQRPDRDKNEERPDEVTPPSKEEQEAPETNEDELSTGTQTGQLGRGSYSTDPATGAGRYADHRSGQFGTDDVAQPGNDQDREPDPIDPQR